MKDVKQDIINKEKENLKKIFIRKEAKKAYHSKLEIDNAKAAYLHRKMCKNVSSLSNDYQKLCEERKKNNV